MTRPAFAGLFCSPGAEDFSLARVAIFSSPPQSQRQSATSPNALPRLSAAKSQKAARPTIIFNRHVQQPSSPATRHNPPHFAKGQCKGTATAQPSTNRNSPERTLGSGHTSADESQVISHPSWCTSLPKSSHCRNLLLMPSTQDIAQPLNQAPARFVFLPWAGTAHHGSDQGMQDPQTAATWCLLNPGRPSIQDSNSAQSKEFKCFSLLEPYLRSLVAINLILIHPPMAKTG